MERLRDLTGSVTELGPLLQWFVDADAFVIALDYELDTSSRSGELAARALVEVSDWERGRVAGRTRPGRRRRAGASVAAVRDDPELSARIAAMRNGGMSLQAIADALNEAGVPTLRGGSHWRPSSVQAADGLQAPAARAAGGGIGHGQESLTSEDPCLHRRRSERALWRSAPTSGGLGEQGAQVPRQRPGVERLERDPEPLLAALVDQHHVRGVLEVPARDVPGPAAVGEVGRVRIGVVERLRRRGRSAAAAART